jgi:D-glycero-D-manno-heptose 1,7-bisphosphate phosphatase
MNRAAFLDLNGTLVLPVTVERLEELGPVPGAADAVARLCDAGFLCPVVTVQSRIAKGYFSETAFLDWFRRFSDQMQPAGAYVLGPYVCPHRFREPCACKKPQTLLYEQAAVEHQIDLGRSFVIGDTESDVEAAHRFGGRGCLLRASSGGAVAQTQTLANHTAVSLADGVDWVVRQR